MYDFHLAFWTIFILSIFQWWMKNLKYPKKGICVIQLWLMRWEARPDLNPFCEEKNKISQNLYVTATAHMASPNFGGGKIAWRKSNQPKKLRYEVRWIYVTKYKNATFYFISNLDWLLIEICAAFNLSASNHESG